MLLRMRRSISPGPFKWSHFLRLSFFITQGPLPIGNSGFHVDLGVSYGMAYSNWVSFFEVLVLIAFLKGKKETHHDGLPPLTHNKRA